MQISKWLGKVIFLLGLAGFIAGGIKVGINYIWPNLHPTNNIQTVYDEAGILSKDQAAFIRDYHRELFKDHDIDYRVLIPRDVQDVDNSTRAYKEFESRKVGTLSRSGRGLLLLVDPYQNEVRLEVSLALEGIYTDAFVSYIQHRQMIPFFQGSRISDGILATTEMIFARAQEAQAGNEFNQPMESKSAGGGAINPAQIGAGEDRTFRQGPNVSVAAGDPHTALKAYRKAMDERNGNPGLSIYTKETQAMLSGWTVTPAQMDNEAKNLKNCLPGTPVTENKFAVIRFSVKERRCPPYFFQSEDGAWKLDLTMMQKAIRFNHRNQWHFDLNYKPQSESYGFAFTGWRFDKYGFPHDQ